MRIPLLVAGITALIMFCLLNLSHHATKAQPSNVRRFTLNLATVPPVVEPLVIKAINIKDAEALNRSVPFVATVGPAARPFVLPVSESSDRAIDCLTAAIYYEAAGEGDAGERAVAQVVLNRVRHPAFPKTVCGVVFQGSDRVTGCQFTFTCDGALMRKPSVTGWTLARSIALSALHGKVFAPVGYATHFHTQSVVPAWRSQLDKLVQIGAHIFYRWSGTWGTQRAFFGSYAGLEAPVASLALLSAAHAKHIPGDTSAMAVAIEPQPVGGGDRQARAGDPSSAFTVIAALDPMQGADGFPAVARTACGTAPRCTFLGWTTLADLPKTVKISAQQRDTMSFSYRRDYTTKTEQLEWNCRQFKDRDIRNCLAIPLLADLASDREIQK